MAKNKEELNAKGITTNHKLVEKSAANGPVGQYGNQIDLSENSNNYLGSSSYMNQNEFLTPFKESI